MNRLLKAIVIVLMLTSLSTRLEAQTPYRQYAEDGIMLNFFNIDNVDFRAYLLYNINKDNRFTLVPEAEYGKFVLTPANEMNNFIDEFERFYQNVSNDFSMLTKNDIFDQMMVWKDGVESHDFLSITMDLVLRNSRSDNDHCVNSLPFCTSDLIEFQAASTSNTANEPGMDDGCIGSSYNPSWYHMRIHTGGPFVIHMEGHDPTSGADRDIDFCMWGPYTEEEATSGWACSNLTGDKIIDCCYSGDETEDVYLGYPEGDHHHTTSHGDINYHVPEVGEYYILMITNFSRQPCVINFTKTEGIGETDCGILPGNATNDGPYCEGETIYLHVTGQAGATYSWTGPEGFTSTDQEPIIPNCTPAMAGDYTCTITVGNETTTATTTVVITQQAIPSFTSTTVCQGNVTEFEGQAAGSNVAIYEWDFGDGNTGNGQDVSHTYDQAGNYQVTLYVAAEDGTCPAEITQTVTVNAQPVANAGPDKYVDYGNQAQLDGSASGGSGFTYHWDEPESGLLTNTNIPNPSTNIDWTHDFETSYEFVLTVTNPQGQCVDMDTMLVYLAGGLLQAEASVENESICLNNITRLNVEAHFGTGNYSYSWSPTTGLSDSHSANPLASPTQTTTYTCTVSDGQTTQHPSVTITVNQPKTLTPFHISTGLCDVYSGTWVDEQGNEQPFAFYGVTSHTFEGLTEDGCHLEQTYYIDDMQYTPHPYIESNDPDVEWPDHPITATEFNVNRYTYRIKDSISDISRWIIDDCEWTISKDSWPIVVGDDKLSCTVYAMDWVPEPILLSFKAVSSCSEEGEIAEYWLYPSFYGMEENDVYPAIVDIVPNPNNGQMQLRFENMEGKIQVKVCDATGTPVDHFEVQTPHDSYTYNYNMKRLSDGVYFFLITDGKRNLSKKVVIIH